MTDAIANLSAALEGRYRVERQAGAGGMATVYLAEDLKHHRKVAIKVLRPELAATVGSDRFLREIEMAARLQHPHIVPVYDSGAGDGILYYVMPFVEGESLRDRLEREKRIPLAESVRLVREVASALAYAHANGIVHRDIKPENIMLSGGHAVVADFGIARVVEAGSGGPSLTGMGLAIGTPAYMSPEQATASDEVDGRSDQYSLACVLYEMVAGKPAFAGASMQAVLTQSITGARPRLATVEPAAAGLDAANVRALATDPAARFPSITEYANAIGETVTGPMSAHAPVRSRRRRIAATAAAIVLVLAAGAFALSRRAGANGTVVSDAQLIAVLPFRTSGPNLEVMGEGMVDLLSTNLDALADMRTVEPRTVLQRWKKSGGSGGADLDHALAIGRDVGARAVLLGSIVGSGATVRLTAELYSRDGQKLARAQADGPADSLIALVDELSLNLVREVWRSKDVLPSIRVAGLTTTSLAAMRDYLVGEQFYRRSEWDSAGAAFGRAVAEDSTFALAQHRLAMAYGWIGNSSSPVAAHASAMAVQFASRLPPNERSLVVAYRLFQQGDPAAADSMRAYTTAHPDDADGWYLLGESLYHQRMLNPLDPAALRAPFDRVLGIDPTLTAAAIHPLELTLLYNDSTGFNRYMELLEKGGATGEIARFAPAAQLVWGRSVPDSTGPLFATARLDAGMAALSGMMRVPGRDPDSSLARLEAVERGLPAGSPIASQVKTLRGTYLVGFGRLAAAERLVSNVSAEGGRYSVLIAPVLAGFAPPGYADSVVGMLRRDRKGQGIQIPSARSSAAMSNPFEGYFRTLFSLGTGDVTVARELIPLGLALDTTKMPPFVHSMFVGADGWLSLLTGDTTAGISKLDAGLRHSYNTGPALTGPLRMQRALAAAARPATRDEGIRRLAYSFDGNPEFVAVGPLALARTYEAAGDRKAAADAYSTFIRLWAKADPSLQPKVAEARQALADLTAERR